MTGTVKKGSPAYYLWRRARYIRTDEKSAVDYASYGGQDDNPNTVALGRLQCSSVHTVVTQCANVITAASRTPCKMCKCATAVVALYCDCKFCCKREKESSVLKNTVELLSYLLEYIVYNRNDLCGIHVIPTV